MDLTRPAVFARNYRHYLEEAAADADPARLITFRSAGHWTTAAKALATHNTIPIYFAVVREGEYVVHSKPIWCLSMSTLSLRNRKLKEC